MARSSGLEREVMKILGHIFKALPAQVQFTILAVMFLGIGVVYFVNSRPPEILEPLKGPQEVPYFDAKDPERTCRWVVAASKQERDVTRSIHTYKGSNPLRDDRDAEIEKAHSDYLAILKAKEGTQILWPVKVEQITQDEVQIKNLFDSVRQDDIRASASVTYKEYPIGRESNRISGKLKISASITLDQARVLDYGDVLFVQGVIETITSSISSNSYDYSYVSISVKDCHVVLPANTQAQEWKP